MSKKMNKIQIYRFMVQIVFFIFFGEIFMLAFSELKQVYELIATRNSNSFTGFINIIELLTTIGITIIFGRFFCGWVCAFGALNDWIFSITSKVFKKKFIVSKKVNTLLSYFKYIVLTFIAWEIWSNQNQLFNTSSPWDAFAQLPEIQTVWAEYTIGFILLIVIIFGASFIERFFCRYLCPLGGVFAIAAQPKMFRISKPRVNCGNCRLCSLNCPMNIDLSVMDCVNSGECINCLKCIEVCPKKNAQLTLANTKVNAALVGTMAVTTLTMANFLGNEYKRLKYEPNVQVAVQNEQLEEQANVLEQKDVVVANNQLKKESNQIDQQSEENVAKPVITYKESTETVIQNLDETVPVDTASQEITVENKQITKYKDGTYTGVGRGFRPGLTVEVTIKNDKITSIEIGSNHETPSYAYRPFQVIPDEIIQAQSTDVDSVSGATRTSNGIKYAVDEALSQAEAANV